MNKVVEYLNVDSNWAARFIDLPLPSIPHINASHPYMHDDVFSMMILSRESYGAVSFSK